MDWIKQIIECKKENWVSPGSLGQKIKKIRMLRKYTQKELGVMCGFSFSSADVRIAQYEKNKKIPREKILKDNPHFFKYYYISITFNYKLK